MFDLETSVLTHFESDFDPKFQVTKSRVPQLWVSKDRVRIPTSSFFSLQPGDQILSINKHDLRQVTKNQAENLINKEINKVSATGQGTVSQIFYDDLSI